MTRQQHLIIVSNRLPVQVKKENDQLVLKTSSGGLVTAVQPIARKTKAQWFGCLGSPPEKALEADLRERNYVPITVDPKLYAPYYNGYCNTTLWPIMHYFTQTAEFRPEDWDAYEKVNRLFAQELAINAPLHATVWVHDYHLMLLPAVLKRLRPDIYVSYFHHIPFPAPDIANMIPQIQTLIDSLLHCDHIGFHTENYASNFRATAESIGDAKVKQQSIIYRGHRTRITANPISIDFEEFDQMSRSEICEQGLQKLKSKNLKIILGVDRLDYTKGILERLEGFRHFLKQYPEWIGRAIILQICVPSRDEVPSYQKLRQKIERLVGEINGTFGSPDYTPVHYFYQSVPRSQLVGIYKLADTMMVTSLRDGMNLVSKEFVAANSHERGVLILSKFAGSALQLNEALLVNPYNILEISDNLMRALSMSQEERQYRMHRLRQRVREANQDYWCAGIFDAWVKSKNYDKKLMVVS